MGEGSEYILGEGLNLYKNSPISSYIIGWQFRISKVYCARWKPLNVWDVRKC